METILAIFSIPAIALASYLVGRNQAFNEVKRYVRRLCDQVEDLTLSNNERSDADDWG